MIDDRVTHVTSALSMLGVSAELLGTSAGAAPGADIAELLSKLAVQAAEFDERVARLAPFVRPPLVDVASDLSDAAEALATRWDSLVPSRRAALVDTVLAKRSQLDALLLAVDRGATADEPASVTEQSRPRAALGAKDAAKAWENWTLEPSRAGADVFLRLSQSWIEGTGAKLAREQRVPSARAATASEVMDRIRHHLELLAGAGPMPYLDALEAVRRRVSDELRDARRPA